jgi:hypothetical protein
VHARVKRGGKPKTHPQKTRRRETNIYERCWYRGHTTFWDHLEKIVICGAGGRSSRREEERTPRNERWWQ